VFFISLTALGLALSAGCARPVQDLTAPGAGDEQAAQLLDTTRELIQAKKAAEAEETLARLLDMKDELSRRKQQEVVAMVLGLGQLDAQRSKKLQEKLQELKFPNVK
jgi:hypothetical protein